MYAIRSYYDHVERGAATAAVLAVIVIDQVLVVGVGVAGLDVPADDAEAVVDRLEHRDDGVGGAAGGGEEGFALGDQLVVDAGDDVGDVALARGGEA